MVTRVAAVAAGEARHPVKSAGRALDVLEALADPAGPRSLVELSRSLGIPKSSLHGILHTLLARGWIAADPTGTRFGLGLRSLQVGAAYLAGTDAGGSLGVLLDQLAARFGETVLLCRRAGDAVVVLAKRESAHTLRPHVPLGARLPAHATAAGRALLAQLSDDAVDRLLSWPLPALTERTTTRPEELRAQLAAVRRRGWAVVEEESGPGLVGVAVALPLRDPALDALAVVAPVNRLGPATQRRVAVALRAAAAQARAARALLGEDF
ncbi:transcriptional regulator, IclR family [Micromonospora eburnea]|uniref:Glycerol operon regulatory protein n=1 Tax=Micromonospora eburnea TaxID=227316 RepID=A0A1C6TVG0_9ACTN|nr:transcriptional regulator, IclR family [Micromonospora eburnea]